MKRSMAILNIATDLVIKHPEIDFKFAQECAEIMLLTAENCGMKPPQN